LKVQAARADENVAIVFVTSARNVLPAAEAEWALAQTLLIYYIEGKQFVVGTLRSREFGRAVELVV
jgi:hypothetical protein